MAGEVLVGVGLVLRACAACDHFLILLPCGHGVFAFPAKFGTPARRAADGGLLGAAPLLDPLCTPPGTPPKKDFQLPWDGEGTRLTLRELPSLTTLAQVISLRDA